MRMVVDTNVFLHYLSFAEANWITLAGETDITITIPETVIKELDQKKFEGATATSDKGLRMRCQEDPTLATPTLRRIVTGSST